MQGDLHIEIEKIRLFDVLTLEAVAVLDLKAVDDLIAMGLQIIHHLFQQMVAPRFTGIVADLFGHRSLNPVYRLKPRPTLTRVPCRWG